MKKAILLALPLISILLLGSSCEPKKVNIEPIVDPSVTREIAPSVPTEREEDNKNRGTIEQPISCGSDRTCFMNQFLECQPSEFRILTSAGEKQLTVAGLAGNHCYFQGGLYKDGVLMGEGLSCSVPKNLMSDNLFNHFFKQDGGESQEDIKAEQDRIEADYCSQI